MKKIILAVAFVMSALGTVSAQSAKRAIGLRFGNGGEISFQSALGSSNRLELDLGMNSWNGNDNYAGLGLTGIYQWVWNIQKFPSGFKWYVGFGPQLGLWNGYLNSNYQGFALGIAGQIGIEYNFKIPIQLSLDYRPAWYILPGTYGGTWQGIDLALRYCF